MRLAVYATCHFRLYVDFLSFHPHYCFTVPPVACPNGRIQLFKETVESVVEANRRAECLKAIVINEIQDFLSSLALPDFTE
jgi:hypothetical protein